MSKVVLGKGLEALIPNEAKASESNQWMRKISLDQLAPNPMQPRHDFDENNLMELAQSIKANGVIQPIIAKGSGSGYIIIAGERRYRAAKLAGLTEVPVVLMSDVDETGMLEIALIENVQREDLNPLEAAEGFRLLIEKCGLTQHQLSERVGKSRTAVTNLLRLLSLPESIKTMIHDGRLTEGHARAILAVDSEDEMLKLAHQIVTDSLSVRVVEKEVRRKRGRKLIPKRKSPDIEEAENELKQILGTSVKINHGLKRGKIEVEYYGIDDLSRLIDLMKEIRK